MWDDSGMKMSNGRPMPPWMPMHTCLRPCPCAKWGPTGDPSKGSDSVRRVYSMWGVPWDTSVGREGSMGSVHAGVAVCGMSVLRPS